MQSFFQVISFIVNFDLAGILKSIAFPFVFVFVCYCELIDILSTFHFELPAIYIPKAIVHPALLINEDLQLLAVKNLRKLQSFPKSYRKQDMINALLITY